MSVHIAKNCYKKIVVFRLKWKLLEKGCLAKQLLFWF